MGLKDHDDKLCKALQDPRCCWMPAVLAVTSLIAVFRIVPASACRTREEHWRINRGALGRLEMQDRAVRAQECLCSNIQ